MNRIVTPEGPHDSRSMKCARELCRSASTACMDSQLDVTNCDIKDFLYFKTLTLVSQLLSRSNCEHCARMIEHDIVDPAAAIARRIFMIRGRRVLFDSDLADLFSVRTARFNQQVRRNRNRFPEDFAFEITAQDLGGVLLQFDQPPRGRGGRRKPAFAFTEHGAIMAATILNSPRAVEMTVYVVRAFLQMRSILASHPELASKLERLEKPLAALDSRTRRQFEEVYAAIRALTALPSQGSRPIGFTADLTHHK